MPVFRSRGKNINLGAWYPWKSIGEKIAPCADSCGIFILTPAVCTLAVGLAQLHEDDAQGIISNDYLDGDVAHVRDPQAHPNRIYDIIEYEGGPGQELGCYLKKLDGLEEKLTPSLTCVNNTDPAARGEEERRKALLGVSEMDCRSRGGTHVALAVREKRLQATLWRFKGENHKGSHFPVCCFTDNMGRRSDDGERKRRQAQAQKRADKRAEEQAGAPKAAGRTASIEAGRTASVEAGRAPLREQSRQSGIPEQTANQRGSRSWPSSTTAFAAEWHGRSGGRSWHDAGSSGWDSRAWNNVASNVQPGSAGVGADAAAGLPTAPAFTQYSVMTTDGDGSISTTWWGYERHHPPNWLQR